MSVGGDESGRIPRGFRRDLFDAAVAELKRERLEHGDLHQLACRQLAAWIEQRDTLSDEIGRRYGTRQRRSASRTDAEAKSARAVDRAAGRRVRPTMIRGLAHRRRGRSAAPTTSRRFSGQAVSLAQINSMTA
jgi:hypothetical protein